MVNRVGKFFHKEGCVKEIRCLRIFFFLICAEGFLSLLRYEEQCQNIEGRSPSASHLLFADDNLLFCKATARSCHALQRVSDIYARASGQQINFEKSAVSFSPNTPSDIQLLFQYFLSIPVGGCYEHYLGLPSFVGREKKAVFSGIKSLCLECVVIFKRWQGGLIEGCGTIHTYICNELFPVTGIDMQSIGVSYG
ncbi:hypothetical protein PanWU01x14_222200 [Parasponia andersonii]|uniref:Reverse transcriptase domain-containing protein n=1 Tax=Parasponia andersonii TaxID=3476 RepID=A0A2P5BPF1_PARAD|nr:hypothetical protein PanWU01x14_222200 [Parasponia andersonii]